MKADPRRRIVTITESEWRRHEVRGAFLRAVSFEEAARLVERFNATVVRDGRTQAGRKARRTKET